MIDFEKDANALTIDDDEIQRYSRALAKRAKVLQREVEDLEAADKRKKGSV